MGALSIGVLTQALAIATAQAAADAVDLPTVYAVSVAPGAGATLDEWHTAFVVRRVDADELDRLQVFDLTDALNRRVVGISLNTVQGNPFQPDLQYRGFTGSPLLGTPQGLAVYQDGVRVNEVFGDTVNWDLLPVAALQRAEVIAGANPVFGLNTLGGAISLTSKDGFGAIGTAIDYETGSFGRRQAGFESGGNNGRFGYYVHADDLRDDSWRDLSPSRARHHFGSFGWRGDKATLDLILAHANTELTGNGAAPVELLAEDRAAIFTAPDETDNRLDQATLRGTYSFRDDEMLSASVFSRSVRTGAYNGDGSDAEGCEHDDSILCEDNEDEPILDRDGQPVSSAFDAINNISTRRQRAHGGNVQFSFSRPLGARDNQLVAGVDYSRGTVAYRSIIEAAMLLEDRQTSSDSGIEIPAYALDVHASTRSRSLYLTDTLSVTEALALTASLRYNQTRVVVADQSGQDPDLNGDHRFSRLNPAIGLAYVFSPTLNFYASYSESTRAPTPVELSCADEEAPCKLPNQFISDPPLEQVVAHSWEAGFRSSREGAALRWQVGVFRTTNSNDILFQTTGGASSNEGFFANVADTRRQGLEATIEGLTSGTRLQWYANYTFLDATFLGDFTESSANHPDADEDGVLEVGRGDSLPGLSRHQLKAGLDFEVLPSLSVGISAEYRSGVYLRGDEANRLGRTHAYTVAGMHARWQAAKRLSLHARVDNLLDRRYESFGALGEPDEVFPDYSDPRFLGPGAPRGAWLGARLAF